MFDFMLISPTEVIKVCTLAFIAGYLDKGGTNKDKTLKLSSTPHFICYEPGYGIGHKIPGKHEVFVDRVYYIRQGFEAQTVTLKKRGSK